MGRKAVAAVALVAVIGAVAAGIVLTRSDSEPPLPRSEVEAFLAAWARGDAATVDRLSGSPTTVSTAPTATATTGTDPLENRQTEPPPLTTPTASGDQARFKEALRISASTLELKGLRREEDDDDVAIATVAATHNLVGLGEWRVSSNLRITRQNDRWRIDWQTSALHPDAAPGDRFDRERRRPERAPILGAGGEPITGIVRVVAVGVQPSRIKDQPAVAAALQQHLAIDPARLDTALKARGVKPDHFVGLVELRESRFRQVEPALRPVPGIVFQRKDARLTPAEGFAAHTIGRTGEITAEQLEKFGPTYQVGDIVGRSGLELAFERQLAGTPSGEITLVRQGGATERLHEFEGTPAQALEITLRPNIQQAADAALAQLPPQKTSPAPPATPGATETPGAATTPGATTPPAPAAPPPTPPPVPAALVAVDAATGQIVAVSSRPLSEPLNRALSGRYPPGSTFKIVTTDALIAKNGNVDQRLSCPAEVKVGGKRVKNFEGEELGSDISLRDAFVHSCNTAFAPAGERLGTDALVAAAARYGFGVDYRVGLGRATGGSFPAPKDAAERAAAAIGQGRVLATPAHMASVIAAATTGTWHAPHLLAAPEAPTPAPAAAPTATPTPQAIDPLRDFLRGVVTEGTARAAARVPDLRGKTGTAEFGTGTPLPTHAWFVGERNGIAFAVILEGGGVGGRDAAPIAATFAAAL